MQESRPWITALVTAYARAYHATHADPKIFDDFAADRLFSAEEHAQFDHNLAQMLPAIDPELAATNPDEATALAAVMELMHCPVTVSRSRYAEDCLDAAVDQSVEQYVILGAGFDTFAFRRPDLLAKGLQVFEVDHPVTQGMKRERIAGWEMPDQLHFVPVDFNKDSFERALVEAGYDAEKRTFFSWLGVTYYLPREAVLGTLAAIRRISVSSTVVFDFMDNDAFEVGKAARRVQLMQASARMVGEPMQTGFDRAGLGDVLAGVGLNVVEMLRPAAIEERYFAGRGDRLRAMEHVHFVRGEWGGV